MKTLVACVAEHAWVEKGCLSVIKTFDSILADKFPYKVPRLSVGLRVIFGREEAGDHRLNIRMLDADGKKIMGADIGVGIKKPENYGVEPSFSFALNAQNVAFPAKGDYVVEIIMDGRLEASVPIYVKEAVKR